MITIGEIFYLIYYGFLNALPRKGDAAGIFIKDIVYMKKERRNYQMRWI